MSLKDREFVCPVCGHKEDRDIHAAKNMLWFFGKRKTLCVERTEYNREEFLREVRVACEGWSHEIHKSLVYG
jgi:transposase